MGLGAGWMEKSTGFRLRLPPIRERLDRLESIGYITTVREGNESGFHGQHYHLAPGLCPASGEDEVGDQAPAPDGHPGWPTFADEFNVFPLNTRWATGFAARRAADAIATPAILFSPRFPRRG